MEDRSSVLAARIVLGLVITATLFAVALPASAHHVEGHEGGPKQSQSPSQIETSEPPQSPGATESPGTEPLPTVTPPNAWNLIPDAVEYLLNCINRESSPNEYGWWGGALKPVSDAIVLVKNTAFEAVGDAQCVL